MACLAGCSPLHVAAQSGSTECVNRILQLKVHVGTQDGRKMTALHHAGGLLIITVATFLNLIGYK